MKIRKYDLVLERLKEKDIELVRNKRNQPEINSTMIFRQHIDRDMQQKWFRSINNIYNNYFLIHHRNNPIGLINGKDINFEERSSEGGMFIWDKQYWGGIYPALASMIMSDFNFIVNEFETNYIRILHSNPKAKAHNQLLGYKPSTNFPANDQYQIFELTKKDYLITGNKLRKTIGNLLKDDQPLSFDEIDFLDDSEDELIQLYNPLPNYLKEKINIALKRDDQPLLSL